MEERSGTRRRALVAVTCVVALGCLLAPSALGAKKPKKVKDTTTWLCKPGIPNNPCEPGFDTTLISPSGQIVGTQSVKPDKKRKFDCFYVYPTVSDDKTPNSDLSIDPEERSIALHQAARYSLHCRVFAPMYRQLTLGAILSGASIPPDAQQIAYGDVAAAWKTYLRKYNHGRGVVLVGHSQGTYVLRELIHQLIDPSKKVRKRLISALLLGGNVTVREDGNVGGDFKNIPGCRKAKQFGCVIAFSSFNAPVPGDSMFGRPDGLAPGLPTTGDVLCTNPAALGGGSALLTSVFPTEPSAPGTTIGLATGAVGVPMPAGATTPWFQAQAYSGACDSSNSAHVLQISPVAGAPTLHAVPDATWGLHLVDANIALGNLTDDVAREAKFWLQTNGTSKKKHKKS
jgi:pimeloyl-ACP methyl ester carboxylesterase